MGEKNGDVDGKMLILENNPPSVRLFLGKQLAEEAFPLFLVVFPRAVQFFLDFFRQEGVAVSLAMGMGHGDAHHIAAVFKNKDIFDVFVRPHIIEAFPPHFGEFVDVGVVQVL